MAWASPNGPGGALVVHCGLFPLRSLAMRRLVFPPLVASLVLCPMMALAAQPHLALAQSLSLASEQSGVQASAQTQAQTQTQTQEGWV